MVNGRNRRETQESLEISEFLNIFGKVLPGLFTLMTKILDLLCTLRRNHLLLFFREKNV